MVGLVVSGKYLVIDPSNVTFSSILAAVDDNIRLCSSNKFQIYKAPQGEKIGYGFDMWRDCIDIAVKLAFNLTVNSKLGFDISLQTEELGENTGFIKSDALKNSSSIKEITNLVAVHPGLHLITADNPLRIKQSSEVIESKQATALLVALNFMNKDMTTKLEDRSFTHALEDFNKDMAISIETIFKEENRQKCLSDSVSIINSIALASHNMVQEEITFLRSEFQSIEMKLGGTINDEI